MPSLIVLRTSSACSTPLAANSMPSPIEHVPCSAKLTATGKVLFSILPAREWSSLIPLPVKPAGKMPSSIFHIYTNGEVAIPKHVRDRAQEAYDRAASTFVELVADGNDLSGLAKPPPVRHTPAQRAAISKVAAVAAARRPVKAMAPVLASAPAPKTGAPKRTRSLIPVRVNAKPQPKATKLVVKPKSILKPARNGDAAFVQHCSEGPPARKGGFRQPSETIANTTMSRFPTSMWGSMALPIDLPDRFAKPVFHWTRATKVNFHETLVKD